MNTTYNTRETGDIYNYIINRDLIYGIPNASEAHCMALRYLNKSLQYNFCLVMKSQNSIEQEFLIILFKL